MRTAALAALVLCTSALISVHADAAPRRHRRAPGGRARAVARPAEPALDVSSRRARALDAFARRGHIRRCWMQQLQRDATSGPRTLSVHLEFDALGRTRAVVVSDPAAPPLARCLAAGAWSLGAVGPGEPFSAEGTLHLDRGE
ncbi:MAG: hypothetical protein U0325_29655 [Polyangiales bacterium]